MRLIATLFFVLVWGAVDTDAIAQTPPSEAEIADYGQLHAAAHRNDVQVIQKLSAAGALLETRDKAGRTPIHVAAHAKAYEAIDALVKAGAILTLWKKTAMMPSQSLPWRLTSRWSSWHFRLAAILKPSPAAMTVPR